MTSRDAAAPLPRRRESPYASLTRPGGGIGRLCGLKSRCSKGRAGSNPAPGMTSRRGGKPGGVTDSADDLELELLRDLFPLRHRVREDWFATELYHALTNTAWRKTDGPEGHLSLSWSRAERIVNELREREGQAALSLSQGGGEGDVSGTVGEELAGLGWTSTPLDTGRHDDAHVEDAADPPPASSGPGEDPEWERRAHEEADQQR